MIVAEVFAEGHESLTSEHLAYIRDMANRVGFSVLEPAVDFGEDVFKIEIAISMMDPVFLVRLDGFDA